MLKLSNVVVGIGAVALVGMTELAFPGIAHSASYGMGPGMMGPGMTGQQVSQGEASSAPSNHNAAATLLAYIHDQHLPCLECHNVSGPRYGPPFTSVAQQYADQRGASKILAEHISHGYGPMPPGMATDWQAAHLASLILALGETGSPDRTGQGAHR